MKRVIATAIAAALAGLALAVPAHATPVPAPSPTPTVTTTADPCVLPSPTLTEQIPQAELPSLRRLPRLPLPRFCFVTVKDLCEGESEVTLHNPIPNVIINYQVADEDFTRGVAPGHTVVVPVSSSLSPFKVSIVLDATHSLLVLVHHYRQPKGCETASPSPTPVVTTPVPTPARSTPEEPQLPVTGQAYGQSMLIGFGSLGLLVLIGVSLAVVSLVARARRRRSAA